MEKFIRRALRTSEPYVPIVPLEVLSQETGVPVDRLVKLDGNENPYGCSPMVQRALSGFTRYHIYPDPDQRELRKALADYVGIGFEYIVGGQGSDDLIDLILRLVLNPGDRVINCVPTFGMYSFSTQVCGGRVVEVLRDDNFAVDVAKVKAAIDKRTKVLFLASPNNPSGNTTPEDDIIELLKTGLVVVVDEAYYEFSAKTVVPLVPRYDNLIVLRTFSKWAGLAGLRVGYGIIPQNIVPYIMKIKQPYNVNVAANLAALESLKDINYLQDTVRRIIQERERLFAELRRLTFLRPYRSESNFIMCAVLKGEARDLREALRRRGLLIRYFDTPQLRQSIRISVGKPEHTDSLISALKDIESTGVVL